VWGPLIIAGVYGATMSSALASLVGAPRILQSVAEDKILPVGYFAVTADNGDPVRGYYLSFAVGAACSLIGSLNAVAPLITMFFMITYGILNLSVFAVSIARTPGWRPKFQYYNKWVSLAGGIGCFAMMFLMEPFSAFISIAIAVGIMWYVYHTQNSLDYEWGTVRSRRTERNVVVNLYKLRAAAHKTQTYRPHWLVLTGKPEERPYMVYFAQCLKKGYGVTIFGDVHIGSFSEYWRRDEYSSGYLDHEMFDNCLGTFERVCAKSFREGVHMLIQTAGMGYLKPNAVCIGFRSFEHDKGATDGFATLVKDCLLMKKSLLICKNLEPFTDSFGDFKKPMFPSKFLEDGTEEKPQMQLWWLIAEGGFELLIPYLLSKHHCFENFNLVLKVLGSTNNPAVIDDYNRMKRLVKQLNLPYSCELADVDDSKEPGDMIDRLRKMEPNFNENHKSKSYQSIKKWLHVANRMEDEPAPVRFVTLPLPSSRFSRSTWHALVTLLGGGDTHDGMTFFIRGNHQQSLTTDL